MAGFDDLIRDALRKQGTTTADSREKVYGSARTALERMIAKNDLVDEKNAASQRIQLETAIRNIESEHVSAAFDANIGSQPAAPVRWSAAFVPPVDKPEPATSENTGHANRSVSSPAPNSESIASVAPSIETPRAGAARPVSSNAPETRVEPVLENATQASPSSSTAAFSKDSVGAEARSPHFKRKTVRERRPFARMLLWTIILVGLAVSGWWAYNFGWGFLNEQLGGRVPNPQRTIETGSYYPQGEAADGWISVFDADSDISGVITEGRGLSSLEREGGRRFLRLASVESGATAAENLLITVPGGVMESLRGKAVTFEVTARSVEQKAHELAIFCKFEEMGSCGRKRFTVGPTPEPLLFDALLEDAAINENDGAGYLGINTDIGGGGQAIDIYAIRVRVNS